MTRFESHGHMSTDPHSSTVGKPEPGPAPRRSAFFLIGSLSGGNLIAMALRMIGGLLIGRLVAPATLGLFNGIGLVLGYIPFLQLGILSGLNRELPYFIGAGDRRKAEEMAAAAQAWALILGAVVFATLTGVSLWELAHGEMWKAAGWFTNAILGVLLFYSTYYLQLTFRTSHDFAKLAMVNVIEGVAALGLLVLVAYLSFYGLCLRLILTGILSTAILFWWRPVRVGPKWNFTHLKHLLKIGAPIFAVGQVFAYWAVIDSTLVLRFTGTEGMGLYSMVLLATSALQIIPQAVSQVLYPRMAEQYAKDTGIKKLIRIARKPIIFSLLGLIPVTVVAWLIVEKVMEWLLPAYVGAVPAMYWAFLLPLIGCFQPLNLVFNVARRQDMYAIAILTGMAVYGVSVFLLMRGGVSLVVFPQAMIIGRVVFMALCYLFIWRLRSRGTTEKAPA